MLHQSEYSAKFLLQQGVKEMPKLWEPYLPQVGLGCVAGASDTGKSAFLLRMMNWQQPICSTSRMTSWRFPLRNWSVSPFSLIPWTYYNLSTTNWQRAQPIWSSLTVSRISIMVLSTRAIRCALFWMHIHSWRRSTSASFFSFIIAGKGLKIWFLPNTVC